MWPVALSRVWRSRAAVGCVTDFVTTVTVSSYNAEESSVELSAMFGAVREKLV